jgi:predicted DNA-binding antitoxin AbrB/MazE fold protein
MMEVAMTAIVKTVEAVYERGYLRPLQPLDGKPGLIYIVTVVDTTAAKLPTSTTRSLRGKYRGSLSSSDEFARLKQVEKEMER